MGRKLFTPVISVELPKEMPEQDLRSIVRNLICALPKLHCGYFIYRKTEPQTISEEEKSSAIAELRSFGIEIDESSIQAQVQRAVVHEWQTFTRNRVKGMLPQHVYNLLCRAKGIRDSIEMLAQSDV